MARLSSGVHYHSFDNSERVEQGWYSEHKQEIILRFPDGTMWWYRGCTKAEWDAFKAASSANEYLTSVLNFKRNGKIGA